MAKIKIPRLTMFCEEALPDRVSELNNVVYSTLLQGKLN